MKKSVARCHDVASDRLSWETFSLMRYVSRHLAQRKRGWDSVSEWELSAFDGRKKVGFVRGARTIFDSIPVIYVSESDLHAEYRGRGVGREMYRRFVDFVSRETIFSAVVSFPRTRSVAADRVWRSLARRGLAHQVTPCFEYRYERGETL